MACLYCPQQQPGPPAPSFPTTRDCSAKRSAWSGPRPPFSWLEGSVRSFAVPLALYHLFFR